MLRLRVPLDLPGPMALPSPAQEPLHPLRGHADLGVRGHLLCVSLSAGTGTLMRPGNVLPCPLLPAATGRRQRAYFQVRDYVSFWNMVLVLSDFLPRDSAINFILQIKSSK